VNAPQWLDLRRPRDLGALLTDGFGTYFRHFGRFLAMSAVVVVPIQIILSGVGLGQLFHHYDKSPSLPELVLPTVANYLITGPLVTAMIIYALLDLGEGRVPSVRRAIQSGLDVFAPLFLAVVLAGLGIAAGFALFIVPGLFLLVRWYFVPETVVVEKLRGGAALQRSWDLVKGDNWRVFGILLQVFLALADSSGRAVFQLIGTIVTQSLAAPATATIGALLYFDLRARREAPPPEPQWPAPPGPGQRP
jgi:hypothetical protein